MFPDYKDVLETPDGRVWVVTLSQESRPDLANWGDEAAFEKDLLLENFVALGNAVAALVSDASSGSLCVDFTDPASGHPMRSSRGPATYPDVEGALTFLKYPTVISGPCKMLSHPQWGTSVYPTTLFCFHLANDTSDDGSDDDKDCEWDPVNILNTAIASCCLNLPDVSTT